MKTRVAGASLPKGRLAFDECGELAQEQSQPFIDFSQHFGFQ